MSMSFVLYLEGEEQQQALENLTAWVNGLLLPFRVTTTLNGDVIEEMTINEFEINRPISPKKFAGPPEPKD